MPFYTLGESTNFYWVILSKSSSSTNYVLDDYEDECQIPFQSIQDFLKYCDPNIVFGGRIWHEAMISPDPSDTEDLIDISNVMLISLSGLFWLDIRKCSCSMIYMIIASSARSVNSKFVGFQIFIWYHVKFSAYFHTTDTIGNDP